MTENELIRKNTQTEKATMKTERVGKEGRGG